MALINHVRKFAFMCEPHTASRAMSEAIEKGVPDTIVKNPHHCPLDRMPVPLDGYTIVSAVRNPFDVLMTKKQRPSTREWTLQEFFDLRWDHPTILASMRFCYASNRIVWFEHMHEDLATIFGCQIVVPRIEKHKTPNKIHWSEMMTGEQFRRFKARDDIQEYLRAFGYSVAIDGTVEIDPYLRAELCKPL